MSRKGNRFGGTASRLFGRKAATFGFNSSRFRSYYEIPDFVQLSRSSTQTKDGEMIQRDFDSMKDLSNIPATQSFNGTLNGSVRGKSPNGRSNFDASSVASGSDSLSRSVRTGNVPLPEKAAEMFDALQDGVSLYLQLAKEESSSQNRDDNNSTKADIQKSTERYLRRLETLLSQLEKLRFKYHSYLETKEDSNNNVVITNGKPQSESSIKKHSKEATKIYAQMEKEVQPLMGSFSMQMQGMEGFARVCPGDQYELNVRYGSQRWKNRGKMGHKRGEQKWDDSKGVFKCLLHDALHVKVSEVKTFGSSILSEKFCDTSGLFSPHPQIMSLRLNRSGSIKLNLVVTWNPLPTEDPWFLNGGLASENPWNFVNGSIGNNHSGGGQSRTFNSIPAMRSDRRPRPMTVYGPPAGSGGGGSADITPLKRNPSELSGHQQKVIRRQSLVETLPSDDSGISQSPSDLSPVSTKNTRIRNSSQPPQVKLPNALDALMEGIRVRLQKHMRLIRSNELTSFSTAFGRIQQLLKTQAESGRSVDHLLLLLNAKSNGVVGEDNDPDNDENEFVINLSTGKISKPNQRVSSLSPSESSSKANQVDACLVYHLKRSKALLDQLNTISPLKTRQNEALHKLSQESVNLMSIAEVSSQPEVDLPEVEDVLQSVRVTPELRELWLRGSKLGATQYTLEPRWLLRSLREKHEKAIAGKYPDCVQEVFTKCLDLLKDDETTPCDYLSVFQYVTFFREKHVPTLLESLAHETWITAKLASDNPMDKATILAQLQSIPIPPPPSCLAYIARMLLDEEQQIRNFAEQYLTPLQGPLRNDIINVYMTFLEHLDARTRRGACRALSLLKARRSIGVLAFVSRCDNDSHVVQESKKAVLSFGEEGREALEKYAPQETLRL